MRGSGLSPGRLARLRDVMNRHVDSGQVPGLVALVARRGEVHVTVAGTMEADGGGGRGLASTADDLLAFCTMLLNKGRHGGKRILSRPSVEVMTTDQLTAEQKAGNEVFFGGDSGWGFGFNVRTRRTGLAAPGQFGWTGGTGTCVYTDPAEELIGILLTQRAMTSPVWPAVFTDFWTCAYQAIDD